MLKFILSENCHVPLPTSLYFCRTMKYTLTILACMIFFIACNDQDHTEKKSDQPVQANQRELALIDSVRQFPDSLLLKEQLIQFYRDRGDYDKAIEATRKAIAQDSLNDRLWEIKATLFYENEDTADAIAAMNRAADINPSPAYIIPLGSMYAQIRDKKALDVADYLLQARVVDTDKEAFFIKGLYHNYTGDKNKAIGFFNRCLDMDYTYMYAYREKAIALYDLGKYDDAITVLDKAVTLRNNFDEGYYWLGRCLEKQNKTKEAVEEYRMALMYAPDYVEAKEALARLGAK